MKRKMMFPIVLLSLGLFFAAANSARANLIANGGFESPTTAGSNGVDFSAPTNWSVHGQNEAWWVCNLNGTWNNGRLGVDPASPAGEVQAFYAQGYTSIYQVTSTPAQPNTVYTLTLDVGAVKAGYDYGYTEPMLQVGVGSTYNTNVMTLVSSSTPAPVNNSVGDWKAWSYTFQTGATVPSGNVRVDIHMEWPGYYSLAAIDNIQLTATATPEPSTALLFGSALLGLVCYAWQKRR
jgi:hypothetical protein